LVIAIDGPAGAGKSTVAKAVAQRLGLRFLDTGAMYRCLALHCERHGVTAEQGDDAARLCEDIEIAFGEGEPQRVFLNGEDVTDAIRTPEIGDFASAVSVHSPVRKLMVRQQQAIVAKGNVVLEGRDTTTVIAPSAPVRIYLTASLEERTRRRFHDFAERGIEKDFEELKAEIAERDHRDSTREDSPLMIGEGVTVIESDGMNADQVVDHIVAMCG
jgi:cytidylate kinase